MRVMTWNIRGLRDNRAALIATIKEANPDLLLLQETPRFFGSGVVVSWLARKVGMVKVAGGFGNQALAIFARADLAKRCIVVGRFNLPRRFQYGVVPIFPRGTLAARFRLDATDLIVSTIHLSLNLQERKRHVEQVVRLLGQDTAPVILTGDLNEPPNGEFYKRLLGPLQDLAPDAADTFPAHKPRRRIDAILGRGIKPLAHVVPGNRAGVTVATAVQDVLDNVPPEESALAKEDLDARGPRVSLELPQPSISEEQIRSATDHLPVVVDVEVG